MEFFRIITSLYYVFSNFGISRIYVLGVDEFMSKSIIQTNKECYVSGSISNLHKHHIFEGIANRKLSEKYGLWVWLREDWHNMADYGVHFNKELDINLKMIAQRRFEEEYPQLSFLRIFGKNYL